MNPDPEPSFSDSSETFSSNSRAKKKKSKKNKKRCKHRKDDSPDPYLSDDSDSSDDSDYRKKNYPIKLCANLTAKLLTTVYKSKIIRFKMDDDPLRRRIYFLTFVESLEVIFSQYTETCEVLLDYPKIGGGNIIEDYAKKAIRDIVHANIDVHSRRLISGFP